MTVLVYVLFSLSIISLGLAVGLYFTKKPDLEKHMRCAHYALVMLTVLISFLASYRGQDNRTIAFGIMALIFLFLFEGFNIFNLYSDKLIRYRNKTEIFSYMALYVLLFISYSVLYGFNILELVVSSVLAVIFYLSSYIIKRNETKEAITLFFIYAILVSLALGISFTALVSSSKGGYIKMVSCFMFTGLILIYSSTLIRHGNMIFDYYPKKYVQLDKITYFFMNLGMSFIALSVFYIFY